MSKTINLTKETFLEKVFNYEENKEWKYEGDKPAIIDFWRTGAVPAKWSPPCWSNSPRIRREDVRVQG
jgi:thioredoxin 1